MAVTVTSFLDKHPEFKTIKDDQLIQTFISDAEAEVLVADFIAESGMADEYVRYLAADKLAKSPYAKSARLVNEKGRTTYQDSHESIWLRALTGL